MEEPRAVDLLPQDPVPLPSLARPPPVG